MRKQEIKLLALARSGDTRARCEIGRRYLLGTDGFPRHVSSGIEYLTHPSVAHLQAATRTLVECLSLEDILESGMLATLSTEAQGGSAIAQSKLGAWILARHGASADGLHWLQRAAEQGFDPARQSLHVWRHLLDRNYPGHALSQLLETLQGQGLLDARKVERAAAKEALGSVDLRSVGLPLSAALGRDDPSDREAARALVSAMQIAEESLFRLTHLDAEQIESALETEAANGDVHAAFALGRALCGINVGAHPANALMTRQNLRKGTALLMRAADGGCNDAWLHLFRVHSDARTSVANPELARFCLEKAASHGRPDAQRRLGAIMLKSANGLAGSERAIAWLHEASAGGDLHARSLLRTLVLPVEGRDADAEAGIAAVGRADPWLAARLLVSRAFGLTKLEALSFDPLTGSRPWGLVVGRNPFVSQIRLSAPRAVPALTLQALEHLHNVGSLFSQSNVDRAVYEGDLRRRSMNQRRLFERLGLEDDTFFARASSAALDSLRLGSKWAFKAKKPLELALAE